MTIILIGPMKVGKTTVAGLLAARLGIPQYALDKARKIYYKEIGYDGEYAQRLVESGSLEAALQYCKPFEVHAVERHLAEQHDCVIDFGAGHSVQDDPVLYKRVHQALAPYPNVVLLLPGPDAEQSISYLDERVDEDLRSVNAYYIRHPANRALARAIVYTIGKSPQETCDEILQTLGIDPQEHHPPA